MSGEGNGLRRAWHVWLVAWCSCGTVLSSGLVYPHLEAKSVAYSRHGSLCLRVYRPAQLAPVKPGITKRSIHQDPTSERDPGTADNYVRDAESLRLEWREASLRLALQRYRSAITLYRQKRDNEGEAKALVGAGEVFSIFGEQKEALIQYRRALGLSRVTRDAKLEADVLNRLAEIEIDTGHPSNQTHAEQALELTERVNYKLGQAGALRNLGVIAYTKHDPAKAIDYFSQALSLWQSEADLAGQAEALTNLGLTYGDSGDVNKARECFDSALDLAKAAGHLQKEARVALAIGLVHTVRGEWQKALDQYRRIVLILDQIGDRANQAVALNGLGYLYNELGEASQALESFKNALDLSHKIGHRGSEAVTLSHIADIYAETGRRHEALRIYRRLILTARRLRDRKIEAYALNNAGAVFESLNNISGALRCYQRALAIAKSLHHPRVQAYALDHLGTLYRRMRRNAEARSHYESALLLMRQAGDRAGGTLISYNIARLNQQEGRIDDALRGIQEVIRDAESLRSDVISSDLRSYYFASVYRRYELLIDLLMQKHLLAPASGYDVAAFEASELGRARSLTEMLIEARANIREGVAPELLEREQVLSTQVAKKADEEMALREMKFKLETTKPAKGEKRAEQLLHNSRALEAIGREITELTAQQDQARTEITASSPKKYAALLRAQPISLKQLQNEVLDSDTVALEYSLGEERSYVWVVSRDSLNRYVLPGKAEIELEAYRFYQALTSISRASKRRARDNTKAFSAARKRLSQILFGPISGSLSSKRVLIVPDGALQYVPFAALVQPNTKEPLVVTHEPATVPSLSVLLELRSQSPGRSRPAKTLAVIADPVVEDHDPRFSERKALREFGPSRREPGARRGALVLESARDPLSSTAGVDGGINFVRLVFAAEEAYAIAALLPESERVVWSGFDANRQTALSDELSTFRIIHFATHGLLDFQHPKLSSLQLSRFDRAGTPQDGSLRLQDVYNLRLSADLVVLSACQTALGKEIRGEGLVGLTRGFMYAGAQRVVASLWNVDDSATAKLMEGFYRKMLGPEKLSPASALRAAQVEMMRDERWQDPYFWAGFVLQGEWK